MNRFKFRVWDKTLKSFDFIEFERGQFKSFFCNSYSEIDEDCIFQQFTGLKDKEGREIYEGDILCREKLLTKNNHKYHPVVWNEGAFFEIKDGEYLWEVANILYIVGNIFENSELLKSNKNEK